MNVVILRGRLSRPPEHRLLPSGDHLVSYEVTVTRPGQRAETVPVAWMEAPVAAAELAVDEEVVVVGRVRRRFFGRGGATQSRTEVAAERVIPVRHRKRASQALVAALASAVRTWKRRLDTDGRSDLSGTCRRPSEHVDGSGDLRAQPVDELSRSLLAARPTR